MAANTEHIQNARDRFLSGQAAREAASEAARAIAEDALSTIMSAIRDNRTTGQARRLIKLLAGLYHGERFPFDLTELRALDQELSTACVNVINFDRYGVSEIHRWGVVEADELNQLFREEGLYYKAQARRIGKSLYDQRYGNEGHKDEGLSG